MLFLMYVHAIKIKTPSNVLKKTVVKLLLIRFVLSLFVTLEVD